MELREIRDTHLVSSFSPTGVPHHINPQRGLLANVTQLTQQPLTIRRFGSKGCTIH